VLTRDVTRVAVLPPFNATVTCEAAMRVWPIIQQQVDLRSYELVPMETVRALYEQDATALPAEVQEGRWSDLAKKLGCDGFIACNVESSVPKTQIGQKVLVEVEFIDGRTGELLWTGQGTATTQDRVVLGRRGRERAAGVSDADRRHLLEDAVARAFKGMPVRDLKERLAIEESEPTMELGRK
jgi:hypothetical protein